MLTENADRFGSDVFISARDSFTAECRSAALRYTMRPGWRTRRRLNRAIADLGRRIRALPQDTVILSDENLTGSRLFNDKGATLVDWYGEILPRIERALDGTDLTVVIYTRDAGPWLRSCHNQAVKNNQLDRTFEEWAAAIGTDFDPEPGLKKLATRLSAKVVLVRMEDELASGALLGSAVLHAAGISPDTVAGLVQPGRLNESLPPQALDLMIRINALPIRRRQLKAISRIVADAFGAGATGPPDR